MASSSISAASPITTGAATRSRSHARGVWSKPAEKVPETVVALHCSGGSGGQWRELASILGSDAVVHTPEHRRISADAMLCDNTERPFTLADEAAPSLQLIDRTRGKVHLVGHSYGGALAMHIALARPERTASVALYEPCAFHLLKQLSDTATGELREIRQIAASVAAQLRMGSVISAMATFVDYWNGPGAWDSLKSDQRDDLVEWAPNVPVAFDALLLEATRLPAYRHLKMPFRLLQGNESPKPVKAVATALLGVLPNCRIDRLSGMGHMGPMTHAAYVARLIAAHIRTCAAAEAPRCNACVELIPPSSKVVSRVCHVRSAGGIRAEGLMKRDAA